MTKKKEQERAEAIAKLREWIKPGDTVYTVLEHVSRSGMQREIRVVLMRQDPDYGIVDLHPNHAVASALRMRQGKRDGLIVSGCGMDMGFHLVYELSHVLYPDGFDCIGKGCPSNDHSNREERHHHPDGGYALKQRWI